MEKSKLEEIKSCDDTWWLRYLRDNTNYDTDVIKQQKTWLIGAVDKQQQIISNYENGFAEILSLLENKNSYEDIMNYVNNLVKDNNI